jgi:hypothetical protein
MIFVELVHRKDELGKRAQMAIHPSHLPVVIHASAQQSPDYRLRPAA